MNTNDLNTALYEKMAAEQDKYRDWLKGQPPEEILHHSYEYTVREDILMSMEELTLSEAETRALLLSPSPMAILYDKFSDLETGYMDTIRDSIEDIARLRTRNDRGEMVPIGSVVTVNRTYGPDPVLRFNGFPAADLSGEADPRVLSSSEAMAKVTELAQQVLPTGMGIDWSDLSYQQATQGKAALVVFPLAAVLLLAYHGYGHDLVSETWELDL